MNPATAPARVAAEPLEAVARFVSGFSHRLQSPLTVLRGYGELAEREENRARRAYWHSQLQGGIDSLEALLDGYRRYQLPERLALRSLPAELLCRDSWEIAGRVTPGSAGKRIDLDIELPADLSWRVDPFHFRNLLVNLFQNALDASPQAGRVLVRAETDELIRVCDQGSGLGALAPSQITAPFFTTRPDRAGLGLAVSHQIATQHGYRLDWLELSSGGLAVRLLKNANNELQRSQR
jgi:signal transduction histidine kinase